MKQVFIYSLLLTLFAACTKETNVNLNNAEPQLVIEGMVTNTSVAEVKLSKTVSFSSSNTFPKVSGATVKITDDNGSSFMLTESAPGTYTTPSIIGEPGHTYNLSVNVDGKEYTASSSMPLQVTLDSLITEKMFWGDKSIWTVKPQYIDPAVFGNSYMFIERINGKRFPDYWIWDDRVINNSVNTIPIVQSDSTINTNDTLEIEMRCIDNNIFRYFTSLQGTKHNETTPANPENKIAGGALGYFSAHTEQKKKVIIR